MEDQDNHPLALFWVTLGIRTRCRVKSLTKTQVLTSLPPKQQKCRVLFLFPFLYVSMMDRCRMGVCRNHDCWQSLSTFLFAFVQQMLEIWNCWIILEHLVSTAAWILDISSKEIDKQQFIPHLLHLLTRKLDVSGVDFWMERENNPNYPGGSNVRSREASPSSWNQSLIWIPSIPSGSAGIPSSCATRCRKANTCVPKARLHGWKSPQLDESPSVYHVLARQSTGFLRSQEIESVLPFENLT